MIHIRNLLFFIILTVVFTSCSPPASDSSASDGVEEIQVWQAFKATETVVFRNIMEDLQKQWRSEGRDVRIIVHFVAYDDMLTKLRTAAMANMTPDIAFVDAIKVTDLAFGQALVQLDGLETFKQRYGSIENAREQFVAASYNAGVVNRKGKVNLYGLPVQTTTVSLFWNRAMFRARANDLKAAGLDPNRAPQDWQEMEEYGRVLTDTSRRIYGYGMQGGLWFNFPIFNMYGVNFVRYDDAGRAFSDIDNANGAAALNRIRAIANSGMEGGAWKRSALYPEAGFINNKYAMILTGPWMVENFANAELDFDISLIPAPTPQEIEKLKIKPIVPELVDRLGPLAWSSSNVGGQTGVIMKSCKKPDLAFEVLDYFTSEKVQRRWASQLGQIPVRRAAWKDLDTSKYPFMPRFMDQLQLSKRIPQIPLFGKLETDFFNPEINLLLQHEDYPVKTMLEHMARGMDEELFIEVNESIE